MFRIINPLTRIEIFPINLLHLQTLLSNLELPAQYIEHLWLIADLPRGNHFDDVVLVVECDFGRDFGRDHAGGVQGVVEVHARVERKKSCFRGSENKRLEFGLSLRVIK